MSDSGGSTPNLIRGISSKQAQLTALERNNEELCTHMDQLVNMMERLARNQHLHYQLQQHGVEREEDNGNNNLEDDELKIFPRQRQPLRSSDNIKMKIPSFHGTSSPEEYLEWVQRVEKIFECQNYTEARKVKLAALEFTDYANLWWENVKAQRRREGEENVATWRLMKRLMERRFAPKYYKQELFLKLQTLQQGAYCVEDYVKEFEMLLMRCDVHEPQEQTIARFISVLHKEIADLVELQPFTSYEDVILLAVKIEKQKKRGTHRMGRPYTPSYSSYVTKSTSKSGEKRESATTIANDSENRKVETPQSSTRTREIKCFRCLGFGHIASQFPNKRVMIF